MNASSAVALLLLAEHSADAIAISRTATSVDKRNQCVNTRETSDYFIFVSF